MSVLLALGVVAVATPTAHADVSRQVYIVQLRGSAAAAPRTAANEVRAVGGRVTGVYEHAIRGYAAELTPAAARLLARNPGVASVEADQVATIAVQSLPTGIDRIATPATAGGASHLTIDSVDDVRVDADIAVIDTGVYAHSDLNVVARTNCLTGSCVDDSGLDDNGHGTHVAGAAAAIDNAFGVVGVAPGARVWSVKVLNSAGSGSLSAIIAGINWATGRANTIDVINLSLGCECPNLAMQNAVAAAIDAGITVVTAAGNFNRNANLFYPANYPNVLTVSALADHNGISGGGAPWTCWNDVDDTLAPFSNWGATVEITAPGLCITSTWNNGSYATISGTSMASPHVAGAAALLASQPAYRGQPGLIGSALIGAGNFDWTDDSGDGIQEPLLDVTLITPVTLPTQLPRTIAVGNAWGVEGGAAVFPVSLSVPPGEGQSVSVKVATANNQAFAPGDFTAVSLSTLTFGPGVSTLPVSVPVATDAVAEGTETFYLNLSAPLGAVLADTQGLGTIVDAQGPLTASIDNVWLMEGDSGSTTARFTVTLSAPPPAGQTVSVKAGTGNGTALAGSDYTALPLTTLNFSPTITSHTVDVPVTGDLAPDGLETFVVNLSAPVGLALADTQGQATIVDEAGEGPITAAVDNVTVEEGHGPGTALVTVRLSAPPGGQTVTLKAATANGTATAGSDYTAVGLTTLSFTGAETTKTLSVPILGDTTSENNETILVNLSAATGGLGFADTQALLTLTNDD